jgi:hypothetical protein
MDNFVKAFIGLILAAVLAFTAIQIGKILLEKAPLGSPSPGGECPSSAQPSTP